MKKKFLKKIIAPLGVGLATVGSAVMAYTPNYTASDLPNIFTDNIGEAGVQFKTYVPLFILVGIVSIGATVYVGVRKALR